MFVYLTENGQERIALGEAPSSWHFIMQDQEIDYKHPYMLVGTFEPSLPSREACMEPALAALKAQEDKINAEAFIELQRIKERREALLCLTMDAKEVS